MNLKEVLRPFQKKLLLEAVSHAVMNGCAAGLAAELMLLIALHLLNIIPGFPACLIFFGTGSALAGILFYVFGYYPTIKKTAARLDRIGLEERISTMVAYETNPSAICDAQRRDAMDKLADVTHRQFLLSFPKRSTILCFVLLALVVGLSFVPYDMFHIMPTYTQAKAVESEEARLIREMIAGLRANVEGSDISDEEKNKLLERLNMLQAELDEGNADLSALAEVMQASNEITEALEALEVYESWAVELTKYESLHDLGEAILDQDLDKVHQAFVHMEENLLSFSGKEQVDALMEIVLAIDSALTQGKPDDSEAYLAYAFASLGSELQSAAIHAQNHKDATDLIRSGLLRAEKRIGMALSNEMSTENLEKANEEDTTQYKKMPSTDSEEESAESIPKQNDEKSEKSSQQPVYSPQLRYSDDPDGMYGAGAGTIDQQHHAISEIIYEPTLDLDNQRLDYVPGALREDGTVQREQVSNLTNQGSVPYSQVYGIYFASLLDQITEREIPESLLDVVEAYFYGM